MVLTQLVDASGIDGSAQELIHLIFRVQSILGTPVVFARIINAHLAECLRVLGPGEGTVRNPAGHQSFHGVGPCPLKLGQHGFLLFPFLAGAKYEEGLNALLLEVRIAFTTTAWLHLIVPVQVLQCSPSDVDAAGPAPGLHVVSQGHIV